MIQRAFLQSDQILILLYLNYKKIKHQFLKFSLEGKEGREENQRNLKNLKVNQGKAFKYFDSKSKDELCFIAHP